MHTAAHMLRIGERGLRPQLRMALRDLSGSFRRLGLAWSLATHDVASRYRGSILGPFWITLSMGLMVLGIGSIYANLFQAPVETFLPYVALGIVFFGTITGTINEGCETFVLASGMLSQTSIPMFTFVWRTLLRNLIYLGHHLVIVAAVLTFYGFWNDVRPLSALAGVGLLLANTGWLSLMVAIISSRFRDIPPIVASATQFAMFVTPVFWLPDRFGDNHAVLTFNPFYHLLQAVRAPLMGQAVSDLTYLVLASMAVAGWIAAFLTFAHTRRRIVHYL